MTCTTARCRHRANAARTLNFPRFVMPGEVMLCSFQSYEATDCTRTSLTFAFQVSRLHIMFSRFAISRSHECHVIVYRWLTAADRRARPFRKRESRGISTQQPYQNRVRVLQKCAVRTVSTCSTLKRRDHHPANERKAPNI